MRVSAWREKELMLKTDRAIRAVEESGAKTIVRAAKNNVNIKTGNLRNGIKARKSRYANGGWVALSTAPHSYLIERGHKIKHRGPDKSFRIPRHHGHSKERYMGGTIVKSTARKVKAYPYMKPAFDAKRPGIMRDFRKIFND